MGFTSAQLAELRAMAESFFDATCDIQAKGSARNVSGSVSAAGGGGWSVVTSAVPCLVRPRLQDPDDAQQAGVSTSVKRFQILMPWNTAVSPGNRLKVGSTIYDVQGSDYGRGNATKVIADCTLAQ